MPTLKLVAEDQIRRANLLINAVKELQNLPAEHLLQKPNSKTWSAFEVIEHMNIAYEIYRPRIDQALKQLPDLTEEQTVFHAHTFPKLFIHMIKPKGKERKWKMKTLGRFEPNIYSPTIDTSKISAMFQRFYDNKAHLKAAILSSRSKKVDDKRIVSAIGPIVKFYLPEAYEFIISHAERHVLQIEETLKATSYVESLSHS